MTLREQIIAAMSVPGVEADELIDPGSEMGRQFREMSDFVTAGVDFLRSQFPDPAINKLMGLVWDLIGNRVTPVALGPAVPTLSMTVVGVKDNRFERRACILVPHNWVAMIAEDHIMQMGALVFVGSQSADFYSNRLEGRTAESIERARAHEAEYLLTIDRLTKEWRPNHYQKAVIAAYPNGVDSARDIMYNHRKYVHAPVVSHGEGHWTSLSRKH